MKKCWLGIIAVGVLLSPVLGYAEAVEGTTERPDSSYETVEVEDDNTVPDMGVLIFNQDEKEESTPDTDDELNIGKIHTLATIDEWYKLSIITEKEYQEIYQGIQQASSIEEMDALFTHFYDTVIVPPVRAFEEIISDAEDIIFGWYDEERMDQELLFTILENLIECETEEEVQDYLARMDAFLTEAAQGDEKNVEDVETPKKPEGVEDEEEAEATAPKETPLPIVPPRTQEESINNTVYQGGKREGKPVTKIKQVAPNTVTSQPVQLPLTGEVKQGTRFAMLGMLLLGNVFTWYLVKKQ